MDDEDIAWLTGAEMAATIRAGRLTSSSALEALLRRVRRLDGTINAVVLLDEDRAKARAAAADAATARGECWGVLHGVPLTVKENNFVAGLDTTIVGGAILATIAVTALYASGLWW